eukprot:166564-Chlamydomonas_euryale.AAC.3
MPGVCGGRAALGCVDVRVSMSVGSGRACGPRRAPLSCVSCTCAAQAVLAPRFRFRPACGGSMMQSMAQGVWQGMTHSVAHVWHMCGAGGAGPAIQI